MASAVLEELKVAPAGHAGYPHVHGVEDEPADP
jgi:hypothetical protein